MRRPFRPAGAAVPGTLPAMGVHLGRDAWQEITLRLLVRSGGLCEARTPWCAARPDGRISDRADGRVVRSSRHHRVPRGMGGSDDPDQHSLDRLLLLCGDGVAFCHGWVESYRERARARGLLVNRDEDPASVPVELASGRLVLLDPAGGFYLPVGWRLPHAE